MSEWPTQPLVAIAMTPAQRIQKEIRGPAEKAECADCRKELAPSVTLLQTMRRAILGNPSWNIQRPFGDWRNCIAFLCDKCSAKRKCRTTLGDQSDYEFHREKGI